MNAKHAQVKEEHHRLVAQILDCQRFRIYSETIEKGAQLIANAIAAEAEQHYIHKDKVRELRDRVSQTAQGIIDGKFLPSCENPMLVSEIIEVIAEALTALLGKEGE